MATMAVTNKKVVINGKQQTVSFDWHSEGNPILEEKSYKKKTRWGTFTQREYLKDCTFIIDGKEYYLQTLFIELAGGGYSRYFIADGIKFPDNHKQVIEHLLNKEIQ